MKTSVTKDIVILGGYSLFAASMLVLKFFAHMLWVVLCVWFAQWIGLL